MEEKNWAYPLSIITLIFFIIYQMYRYALQPSWWMVVLTVFDVAMIYLTFVEYKRIKMSSND
jgi:uncharacterized membrane protein